MGVYPDLPAEGEYGEVELDFISRQPPGLWPTNQDSYFGQLRAVICDQLQTSVDDINELFQDLFATTTTREIALWEEEVGLPTNPTGLTIEDRRARVLPFRRRGPFTRERRDAIIEPFILATLGDAPRLTPDGIELDSGGVPLFSDEHDITGTYHVVENVSAFSFDIRINNTITIDEDGLRREMGRVMPGHLSFTISYVPDVFAP